MSIKYIKHKSYVEYEKNFNGVALSKEIGDSLYEPKILTEDEVNLTNLLTAKELNNYMQETHKNNECVYSYWKFDDKITYTYKDDSYQDEWVEYEQKYVKILVGYQIVYSYAHKKAIKLYKNPSIKSIITQPPHNACFYNVLKDDFIPSKAYNIMLNEKTYISDILNCGYIYDTKDRCEAGKFYLRDAQMLTSKIFKLDKNIKCKIISIKNKEERMYY